MQAETKRILKKKNPQRNVGHFKCIDICILGISEGEEIKEQEKKMFVEIIAITSQVY